MLLDPHDWSLASRIDDVLPALSRAVAEHAAAETHGSALELVTGRIPPRRRPRRRSWATCAPGSRRTSRRSGCAPRSRARIRSRSGATSRSRPARATSRSTTRCASSRGASRRSRCTSTSPCPTRSRRSRAARPARARAAAARARRELAVLAGARHRARRRARADLRHVPAGRHPAAVRRATPSTSRRSTCCCAAARSPSRRSCGGTCGCSPSSGRSRCGSWTRRRASRDNAALAALVQCARPAGGDRGLRGRGDRRAAPRCSTRTASWPTRDGMRAEFIDPERNGAGPRATSSTSCSPRARRTPPSSAARPSWRGRRRWRPSRATTASGCSPACARATRSARRSARLARRDFTATRRRRSPGADRAAAGRPAGLSRRARAPLPRVGAAAAR